MRLVRSQYGTRTMLAIVALCACLFGAWRYARDSRPPHLYMDWLGGADLPRREMAVAELAAMGPSAAAAVPALARSLLRDESPVIRARAGQALAKVVDGPAGDPSVEAATSAFLQAIDDPDPMVRRSAVAGLGAIRADPLAVARANRTAAEDRDPFVRATAISGLADLAATGAVDRPEDRAILLGGLLDDSLHVRELSRYAVLRLDERAPGVVAEGLATGDARIRRGVVIALSRSSPRALAAFPKLMAALKDPDVEVRAGAALAIGTLGPGATWAAPPLAQALKDEAPAVRRAAAIALTRLGPAAEGVAFTPVDPALDEADATLRAILEEIGGVDVPGR